MNLDKPHVEERVSEWKKRLKDLFSLFEDALSHLKGVECKQTRHTEMYEGLMQAHDVKAQSLPILDVYKNGKMIFSVKPIGLWVIGANGRVDILTERGAYIVVDVAEYGQFPKWRVFSPKDRTSGAFLDSSFIVNLADQL